MRIIILSGGSGKRLWPLSTNERPKQLLEVLPSNTDENVQQSMIQRIVEQLLNFTSEENILITTTKSQRTELEKQVPNIPIICEPEINDTFPAISLASLYLLNEKKCQLEEVVAVISADAYVEDEFFEKIYQLKALVEEEKYALGLIGIKPTNPSTRFGYIIPKNDGMQFEVDKFVEKPQLPRALTLIQEGALWNSGVFVFPLKTIISKLENIQVGLTYEMLLNDFQVLPKISFDFAVVEKINNILCLEYKGEWDDLGSWPSLLQKVNIDSQLLETTEDCQNINVINQLGIDVKVIGLSDIVVVLSEKGILISNVNSTDQIKNLLNKGE